ncbi:MAG: sarcosine oxidase subunit delta [Minwuia sp.]|nr:sarcosine oxidase subunit delta [Minwuia sp.]
MIIDCPVCGPRHLTEFSYGGEASRTPVGIAQTDQQAWEGYVFARNNPRGLHDEHWQHSGGCRSWLHVRRDVTNHRIHSVRLMGPFAARHAGHTSP